MSDKRKFIGRSVPRLEDRPLLLGQGRFAADISFPGQWYMRVVRSDVAHGKITAIDTVAALALPGVHAVWTHADVAHIPHDSVPADRPQTARALSAAGAGKGCRALCRRAGCSCLCRRSVSRRRRRRPGRASIEPRPATTLGKRTAGPVRARTDDRTRSHSEMHTAMSTPHSALRTAIVSLELSIGRHTGVPMETRGAIARYDEARDVLEMHGAAKVPHWNRDTIALMLGRGRQSPFSFTKAMSAAASAFAANSIRKIVLVCAAALKFRRPIKWIEDRREHLIAANHSREQQPPHPRRDRCTDGRILGIDDEFFHDNGAYMRTHAATVPDLAAAMLPGPYRVPAYRARRPHPPDQQDAVRHLSRAGPLRIHLRARAADGRDRREGRHRPRRSPPAQPDRQKRDALCARPRHARHPHRLRFRRLRASARQGADSCATGTSLQAAASQARAARREGRRRRRHVRREKRARPVRHGAHRGRYPTARSRSITGVASIGQGVETVIAQICADTLGVDYANIRVIHGQTDRIDRGMGAFASRVTVMCGEATRTCRREAARAGAERRRRADADAGGNARHRRRRDRSRRRAGPIDAAGRSRAHAPGGLERRGDFQVDPHGLSLRRARRCRARRSPKPAASRSSAMWSPTTSATPSTRCWSKARSPAAWRKASAARCWRNSATTRPASRFR